MNKKSGTSKAAADKLVKTIRRKTRQTYSSEEKVRIVLAGLRGEESTSALCRREGIAESLYYSWSKEFLAVEVNVAIACPEDPEMPALAEEGFTLLPIKMRRNARSLAAEWHTFRSVWRAIAQFRPNVLHLITSKPVIYGGLAARAMGIPSLSAISGLGYVYTRETLRHRILRPAVTKAYGMSENRAGSHVLFQNESDLRLFRKAGLLGKAQVSIIPGSGVDLDRIRPAALK